MRLLSLLVCVAAFSPVPALANDGFGGLSATGLSFGQTDAVAMQEEDLFISIDKITVDYVFKNVTDTDVTGEVIFPLPPIALGQMVESAFNLPDDPGRANLVNFSAHVDGAEVAVMIDRLAVIEPPWDQSTPLSAQYDTPGRDVTAQLAAFGLPLSTDITAVVAAVLALPLSKRDALKAAGLVEFYVYDDAGVQKTDVYPNWSVILRYHWTQTFPAGAVVKISHGYENHPPGGLFSWQYPATEEYHQQDAARYCIDDGTSKALAKTLSYSQDGEAYIMGTSHNLSYVLRTANSWAGPIGKFRLTLDKGAPGNVISLCADGIKKTGPTTFVMEKTNYTPTGDLEILVAAPMQRD